MRTGTILLAVLLTVTFVPVGAAETPKPAVSLEGDSTVVFCPTCKDRTIRVGVIPEGTFKVNKTPKVEQPIITEVAFEKMRDASIQKVFQPAWVLNECGTPRAIEISVALDQKGNEGKTAKPDKPPFILKPGTYTLSLSLQPRSAPAAPRLKLQVIYPEADLEVPAKLTVYREEPLLGNPEDDKPELDLRETKGLAPLTDLRIQKRGAFSGTRSVGGNLDVKLDVTRIEAGKILRKVNYDLIGNFPYGVTTGSLRLFANELKEPKTLEFEVQKRLKKSWLIFAIALGLVASVLVRYVLTERIQLIEARIAAEKVTEQILADRKHYADNLLRVELNKVLDELRKSEKGKASEITAAVRKASDDRQRLIDSYEQELKRLNQDYKAWQKALKPRSLPKLIDDIRLDMAKKFKGAGDMLGKEDISGMLEKGNISGVKEALETLVPDYGQKLRESIPVYEKFARGRLEILATYESGLPARVRKQFADTLAGNPLKFDRTSLNQLEKPEEFEVVFQKQDEFYGTLKDKLDELAFSYGNECSNILNMLKEAIQTDDEDLKTLEEKVTEFGQRLGSRDYDKDPESAHKQLRDALDSVQAAWVKFFEDHQAPSGTTDLVKKQEFAQAAEGLVAALKKTSATILGSRKGPTIPPPQAFFVTRSATVQGESFPDSEAISIVYRESVRSPITSLHWWEVLLKGVRVIILGAILAVYYWMAASATYTGMPIDVWNVFLTAFAADFAVDAISNKLKPKGG